jgi:hypothetical protein
LAGEGCLEERGLRPLSVELLPVETILFNFEEVVDEEKPQPTQKTSPSNR